MRTFVNSSLSLPPTLMRSSRQSVQLHAPRSARHQLPPQGVHQPVGTSVQEQPELVGDQPMAAQTVRLYVHLEVLDPVLALPTPDVELIEVLGPSVLVLSTKRVLVPCSMTSAL